MGNRTILRQGMVNMANHEHVTVARNGYQAIDEWLIKNPGKTLDLSGADLSKVILVRSNLSQANMANTNLSDANMTLTYLYSTNLFNADMSRVTLSNANLFGANLAGANLSETKITATDLSQTKLMKTDFSRAEMRGVNAQGADLSEARFIEADIKGSDFVGSNFSGADLSRTKMFETNLAGANLSKSSFCGATLSNVTMRFVELAAANFSNCRFYSCALLYSDAHKANFTGATINGMAFGACRLGHGLGLETIQHEGPSFVDWATLALSAFHEGSKRFAPELELFFLRCGVPKQMLDILPEIMKNPQYYKSFICYGEPDHAFAKELYDNLWKIGASCWFYPMDSVPGERTWGELAQRRKDAEKMIVLCSSKALVREGVLKEIEEQIDEEEDKIIPISLDELWKAEGFSVKRGRRDLKPFLIRRNYADFSDPSKYDESFCKLLSALKRK